MPALSNLHDRIKSDGDWHARFRGNLSSTLYIAKNIPLIHVTSKTLLFADLIILSNGILTATQPSLSGKSPTANDETRSGLMPSLYFYAGRAYPVAGGVAIAMMSSQDMSHTGTATPFDTGGMIRGYIRPISASDEGERADFIAKSLINLPVWRSKFARYLAAYFDSPSQYMRGKPSHTDPEGILVEPNNEFRAWTFEVRYHEEQTILTDDVICWYAQERHIRSMERLMSSLPPSEISRVELLYERGTPTPNYLSEMEKWVTTEFF
jgi:hypothetical protein